LPEEFDLIGAGDMFKYYGAVCRKAKKYPIEIAHNFTSLKQDMEKVYTWTGDIALATKSEYIRAHGNIDCSNAKYLYNNYQNDTCKTTNYLYKSAYWYWLLSPYSSSAYSEFLAGSGYVHSSYANVQSGSVHPVLYLKSNITLQGNGTNDENIYKIVS
jgi:hypothetical protein